MSITMDPNCPTCGHRLAAFDARKNTWWCGSELREVSVVSPVLQCRVLFDPDDLFKHKLNDSASRRSLSQSTVTQTTISVSMSADV